MIQLQERRSGIWLAGISLTVLLCLGAQGAGAMSAALTYSWPTNAGPLDPRAYAPNQKYAQAMVYEPLVRYTSDGSVEPWLASHWDISPDGKIYTFTLRDDVAFSDGAPFDALSAKANLDLVLANRSLHQWMELVSALDRVEAPDKKTLRLVLKRPYYPTLLELAQVRPLRFASPLSKPGHPIGTGPWVLADTRPGEYDIFQRNDHYWGKKPIYKEIRVNVIPDPNSRAVALQTGNLDLIQGSAGDISPAAFSRLKDLGFDTAVSAPMATRFLAMNTGQGPTQELAVRRAINEAVDKQAITEKILDGLEPPADTLFSPNLPYSDLHLTPYVFDPSKAASELEAAGWLLLPNTSIRTKNGKPLTIEVVYLGTNALEKNLAEVLQGELSKVGITLDLRAVDDGSLVRRQRSGQFGMIFATTWGALYDPHSFVSSMRHPSHADYMAQQGLANKDELDKRITQVLASTDPIQRAEDYRFILTTLHDQAVYLPISYLRSVSVNRKSVTGVHFGSTLFDIPFESMSPVPGAQ